MNDEDILQSLISGDDDEGYVGIDEIAYDEIAGDDDDGDFIGKVASSVAKKIAMKAAAKRAGAVAVKKVTRDRKGVMFAPWPAVVVAAGAQQTVTIRPQRLIKIHAISVPSFLNQAFVLQNLTVGQNPQFIQPGQVPVTAINELADGQRHILELDSADIGLEVSLDFLSIALVNQTLRGTAIAVAVF